jgi:uncharacterized protein (DUF885 family)
MARTAATDGNVQDAALSRRGRLPRLLAVALCHGFLVAGSDASAVAAPAPTGVGAQLRQLFADEWAQRLRDDPLYATAVGAHDYDDRLPAVTPADFERRQRQDQQFLQRLGAIPRAALTPVEQLDYDLFDYELRDRIALARFRDWRIPLTSDSGFHSEVLLMADGLAMTHVADYEHFIARLNAVPAYFEQQIANLRQGMAEGATLPAAVLPGVLRIMEGQQYARPEDCPLFEPLRRMPAGISAAEQERLRAAGRAALATRVLPAYAQLLSFMRDRYAPAARQGIAAAELPDGQRWYAALVRHYTTLDVSPAQVHRIGLAEVARIQGGMAAAMRAAGFQGDFAAFQKFLRSDPQFYAATPQQLLERAAFIAKQIDGRLPGYFGRLPRQPYSVQPVPADLAPNYTAGRYSPAPLGATHGGEYWVNTTSLDQRPLYALTALTLHEAVPGHHLQIALARELEDVPPFRQNLDPDVFVEGWALYAEQLGVDMGMYHTPYDEFGRLTYEMWRACRLVVDTGMHALGWSREQAREYLRSHTALSEREVQTEIDRYISWPGQALAYKTGEMKILELRERARRALGERFDIRAFHDVVLGNGGVPLPVLERQVDAYIARARASAD